MRLDQASQPGQSDKAHHIEAWEPSDIETRQRASLLKATANAAVPAALALVTVAAAGSGKVTVAEKDGVLLWLDISLCPKGPIKLEYKGLHGPSSLPHPALCATSSRA